VVGGGVIPEDDIPGLIEAGIAGIFTPGTPTSVTIDFIKNNIKRK
jgi:methylmalonyl-CoA mutase C-terminal domain/subunit